VDVSKIAGTGIGGRVTKQDILAFIAGRGTPVAVPAPAVAATTAPAARPPQRHRRRPSSRQASASRSSRCR